jgi:transcriptional regulator with XRE-family HTH domain
MVDILSVTEQRRQPLSLSAAMRLRAHFPRVTLPSLIRAMRKKRGLTQVQLAALLGVSKGAVAQWELEEGGTTPSVENMARLRQVLDIDVRAEASAGSPKSYQFVQDPEKLAWLTLFELMDDTERLIVARMIRGAVTVKAGPTTATRQNADPP